MILLSVCSCSRPSDPVYYDVPAEVQPIISRFQAEASAENHPVNITNLTVVFTDMLLGDIIGMCAGGEYKNNGVYVPNIKLNVEYWQRASDSDREQLIYHELGHCFLKRSHDDTTYPWGAASIMHPVHIRRAIYMEHRDYYVHELFHPAR